MLSCSSHASSLALEKQYYGRRLTRKLPFPCRSSTRWHGARWRLLAAPCPCCRRALAITVPPPRLNDVCLYSKQHHAVWLAGGWWHSAGIVFEQAYAFSFFGIPLLRWITNQRRNAVIEAENNARRDALDRLRLPDPELRAKMQSAAQRAQRRVIRDEVRIFSPRPVPVIILRL